MEPLEGLEGDAPEGCRRGRPRASRRGDHLPRALPVDPGDDGSRPPPWRVDLSPLRSSRDLRLLFAGGGISFAGSMVTFVALPYQAYHLSHSSLVVGLLSLAELGPLLVTAFIGGALADAVDRRMLIRLTEAGMGLASVALLANALVARPALWVLFACAALFATLDGLQRPSLEALVPRIVESDDLPATSALLSLRTDVGMIAAPAVAGVIIAAGGLPVTYAIDVVSFVLSLGVLA
ncbi:MAG TPA: MFS transporter, partial [Acidimicrobiales bacterium]|nr:MFS transporter [Acidimicrobiales bacterium]